jgi:hypothetical protein
MLDEPGGSLPLHLKRQLPQPIARQLAESQKKREALIVLLPLDRGTSSVRVKLDHKAICYILVILPHKTQAERVALPGPSRLSALPYWLLGRLHKFADSPLPDF